MNGIGSAPILRSFGAAGEQHRLNFFPLPQTHRSFLRMNVLPRRIVLICQPPCCADLERPEHSEFGKTVKRAEFPEKNALSTTFPQSF
jgi:hypothetical protein